MLQSSDLLQQETARAIVYRRLAGAFRPPQDDLPQGLTELVQALDVLGSEARRQAHALAGSLAHDDPTAMAVDFARLFAGPFLVLAPPYGSIYLEGVRRLMGDSTMAAREHYRHQGLDVAPEFKEAPDHISAELEFVHVLVCQEVAAIQACDRRLLLDSLGRQQTFLTRHIGQWVDPFATKVLQYAETDLYRRLADVTRRFILEDCRALSGLQLPSPAAATTQVCCTQPVKRRMALETDVR